MPKTTVYHSTLQRGEISRAALGRVDLEKLQLSAETQINFQPLAIGPATLRAGTGYIGEIASDLPNRLLEFVYDVDDAAIIELTNQSMRVWINDVILTRAAVTSTIQTFASWATVVSPNASVTGGSNLVFNAVNQGNSSTATGTITVPAPSIGVEHALRIVVSKGPILFKVGTTAGDDDLINATYLETGTHSLAFTPTGGTCYARFESSFQYSKVVDSCVIETAGIVTLPTPWQTSDLNTIQYDASGNVIFLAQRNYQQRRIERRTKTSWSFVLYKTTDGPFPSQTGDPSITMTPSNQYGDITVTASKPFFKAGHVGSLIRIFHTNTNVGEWLSANDTYCQPIKISGVGTDRDFIYSAAGVAYTGTLHLFRTFDPEGLTGWAESGNVLFGLFGVSPVQNDGLANVIVWYRIGFAPGDYTSGSVKASMHHTGGGGFGVGRIVSIASSTSASVEAILQFNDTAPSSDWRMSVWDSTNPQLGWPSGVAIHEGRLWWAGAAQVWGSVSDAYQSFDFEKTGDAAPIQRSIGKGPIANIGWLLSLNRLCLGATGGVITARSNSFDDILTPSVFNLKYSTTQGVHAVRPIAIDTKGIFVQRSGRRVYGLQFSTQAFDYITADLTRLNLDIGVPGFVDAAVQRQPDTHIRFPRGDGMMASFLYDEQDDIQAWWRVQTDGIIEQVAVLPGPLEDKVYISVLRTINSVQKRYLERFARLDECVGGSISKLADAHVVYQGAPTTTLTGLGHLEGKAVVVWADGKEVGFDPSNPTIIKTYTVSGGQITNLPVSVSNAVAGLPYSGQFLSAQLAYGAAEGTAVNQPKRVGHLGMTLLNTHYQGARFTVTEGETLGDLRSMPLSEGGKPTPVDTIWTTYNQQMIPQNSKWDTDSRFYLEARSPRPCTIAGVALEIQTNG